MRLHPKYLVRNASKDRDSLFGEAVGVHSQAPHGFQCDEMCCPGVTDEVIVQKEMHEGWPVGADKCDNPIVSYAIVSQPNRSYVCRIETTYFLDATGCDVVVKQMKYRQLSKAGVPLHNTLDSSKTCVGYVLTTHVKGEFASEHCVTV